jgi:hypothetical protein
VVAMAQRGGSVRMRVVDRITDRAVSSPSIIAAITYRTYLSHRSLQRLCHAIRKSEGSATSTANRSTIRLRRTAELRHPHLLDGLTVALSVTTHSHPSSVTRSGPSHCWHETRASGAQPRDVAQKLSRPARRTPAFPIARSPVRQVCRPAAGDPSRRDT